MYVVWYFSSWKKNPEHLLQKNLCKHSALTILKIKCLQFYSGRTFKSWKSLKIHNESETPNVWTRCFILCQRRKKHKTGDGQITEILKIITRWKIRFLFSSNEKVKLLWKSCQIPCDDKRMIHCFSARRELLAIQQFNMVCKIMKTSRLCGALFFLLDLWADGSTVHGTCLAKLEDSIIFFVSWEEVNKVKRHS